MRLQTFRRGFCLCQPDRVQRRVDMSLQAALRIPVGFAVADKAEAGSNGHAHKRINNRSSGDCSRFLHCSKSTWHEPDTRKSIRAAAKMPPPATRADQAAWRRFITPRPIAPRPSNANMAGSGTWLGLPLEKRAVKAKSPSNHFSQL